MSEVATGLTVVFDNTSRPVHTATTADGSFDSDLVLPGGSFERRFDQPGTFAVALAGFTVLTRRIGAVDTSADV